MSLKSINPETLSKIGHLDIKAKNVVEGFFSGMHASPYHGISIEFAQHRQYSSGDELKHIDWKVYGRTDKFFVKQFQEETNMKAHILLDISKSMEFSKDEKTDKLTYALNLAACLSYILIRQEDSIGLITFDRKIIDFIPSRSGRSHFGTIVNVLEKTVPGKDTGIKNIIDEFSKYLKKRGLIIFISDLMDEPGDVLKSLKLLKFKHHDIMVFHILSAAERDLPFKGMVNFESLEDPQLKIKTDTDFIIENYKHTFNTFIQEYKIGFRKSGIDYCLLYTDTALEIGLSSFLTKRK